jgi:hypothetical protein
VTDRKALLRAYKDAPPPGGVYLVRNRAENRILLGASPNVAGRLNRERFQLEANGHASRQLQADWNRLGPEAFAFEVLDTLEPSEDPEVDPGEELAALLGMWEERLGPEAGERYPAR